jgi:hypothetical protein
MKKLSVSLLLVVSLAFVMSGCKKVNCDDKANAVSDAATAYVTNMNTATCEAYYDAIQDWYDHCTVSATLKSYYDAILENADCGK